MAEDKSPAVSPLATLVETWRAFAERTTAVEARIPKGVMDETASRMRGLRDQALECAQELADALHGRTRPKTATENLGTMDSEGPFTYPPGRPHAEHNGQAEPPQPSQGWQAIATCPPCGLFLLAREGFDSQVIGWRDSAAEYGFGMEGHPKGVWFKPTHWMPLPPSPTATVNEYEKRITGTMLALGTARKDADAKGIKRGHGGASEVACPVCNGVLRYSVAGVNGHLWGKCETVGCVQWMQ